jgi:hypothetical protein
MNVRLEDLGVDGRIIVRCVFRTWDVGTWTESIWLRIGDGDRWRARVNAVMTFGVP